jgi:hypothetical protein
VHNLLFWFMHSVFAAESTLHMEGDSPSDTLDHFFLPFEVPEGTQAIEIRHSFTGERAVLDWGVDDPDGFRGWGGGNSESAQIQGDAASRSYRAGEIQSATWQIVVGKASMPEGAAHYSVDVVLHDEPILEPEPERGEWTETAALFTGARWYAGDLHVHSRESGDASPTLDEVAAAAQAAGLDFVVLTEHNTDAHLQLLSEVQARWPDVLLVPGIEFTTYDGHAGLFGATQWVDHRIGQPGVDIDSAFQAAHAQGALVVINHPNLDLGEACIGCAWAHEPATESWEAIEIITGGWEPAGQLFFDRNITLWESWLDQGRRVAAVGGSDDHRAGTGTGPLDSPVGSPRTWIWAEELSIGALKEGLRQGLTAVHTRAGALPLADLRATGTSSPLGEHPFNTEIQANVSGGVGLTLVWLVNGERSHEVPIGSDPFLDARRFPSQISGGRVRIQLESPEGTEFITSHLYLQSETPADSGPIGNTNGDSGRASPPDSQKGGCSCASTAHAPSIFAILLPLVVTLRRHVRAFPCTSKSPPFSCQAGPHRM